MKPLYRTICIFLATFFFAAFSWASGGGNENKSNPDSTKTNKAKALAPNSAKKNLNVIPIHIPNPDWNKAARWDTTDINIYHVDMTMFRDTLTYTLQDPDNGKVFTLPVANSRVTSGFGYRRLFGRKFHKGVDFDLETGDQVLAAMDGTIRIARYSRGYGNFVVIAHEGGLETLYGHMSELLVTEGQVVTSGDVIGLGGSTGQSTGSHLHFEFRVFGEQVDPSHMISYQEGHPVLDEVKVDASWFDHLLGRSASFHMVSAGESLGDIAEMYEVEPADIKILNTFEIADEGELEEGLRIRIE